MSLVRILLCLVLAIHALTCAVVLGVVLPPLKSHLREEQSLRSRTEAAAFVAEVAQAQLAADAIEPLLAARARARGWTARIERPAAAASSASAPAPAPAVVAAAEGEARLPLQLAGQTLGELRLAVSAQEGQAVLRRVLWGTVLCFAVLGAGLAFAILRLAAWGRQPLAGFHEQIRGLSEGRYVSLNEPRVREWVDLSKSLNVMVSRIGLMLSERDQLIHNYQNRLDHDALTQAQSRESFMQHVEAALGEATGHGAVAIIRLNDLEGLNRRLGRARTDDFLVSVATTLRTKLQQLAGDKDHVLARLNGADFGLLLGVSDMSALEAHLATLAKALAGLAHEGLTDSAFVAWIGGSTFRRGETLSEVLSRVDAMLGRSAAQQTPYSISEPSARHYNIAIAQWRVIIENALETGRVRLQSYPVVDREAQLIHDEGMLRLLDPDGEPILASDFIAPAIRSGRITELDLKAVELALSSLSERTGRMAVNLAQQSLVHPMFLRRLDELLAGSPNEAARLSFEVRELDLLSQDWRSTAALAKTVQAHGCEIGIDHFGTTLSVLPLLASGAIRYVKLSPQLAGRLTQEPAVRAFLDVLIELSRRLGIRVIGNGLQTDEEMALLRAAGCAGFTGPLITKAVTP